MRVPYTLVFRQYRMKQDNVNTLSVTVTVLWSTQDLTALPKVYTSCGKETVTK
jgi:hypothetical protein